MPIEGLDLQGSELKFSCIVLAAGRGLRARSADLSPASGGAKPRKAGPAGNEKQGRPANKVLIHAAGSPILYYSLRQFAQLEECRQIVLVANRDEMEKGVFNTKELSQKFRVSATVEGGERRVDSVRRGFAATDPSLPLVAIHDAARPFVSRGTILDVVRGAQRWGAAVAAVAVADTLKYAEADMFIEETVSRQGLYQAQTPQVFKRELLEQAFAKVDAGEVTDDAQMIEKLGGKVKLVKSETTNLKITTPEDLKLAVKLLPVWDVEK